MVGKLLLSLTIAVETTANSGAVSTIVVEPFCTVLIVMIRFKYIELNNEFEFICNYNCNTIATT